MYWGEGSDQGLLTAVGYVVVIMGAFLLWFNRDSVPVWMHDEVGAIRRKFSRRAVGGGFAGLREEYHFKLMPQCFLRRLSRVPRRRVNRGAILLAIGALLMVLDVFV
jgi:hypothetical protein